MVVALEFQIQGWDRLSRLLSDMSLTVNDLSQPLWESIDVVQQWVNDNFKQEWSKTWGKRASLDSATSKARSRRWWYYKRQPNKPGILRWTWKMQESVKKKISRLYADIEWTTPYARFHQEWWGNLPRRKFIDLNKQTKDQIMKKIQTYLYERWWLDRRK